MTRPPDGLGQLSQCHESHFTWHVIVTSPISEHSPAASALLSTRTYITSFQQHIILGDKHYYHLLFKTGETEAQTV